MIFRNTRQGFTLIELLVVILIVAVLAAIALPQYQKAVVKSQISEMFVLVDSLAKAEKMFYLTHGTYTNNYTDLDIDFSLETTTTSPCSFGPSKARRKKGIINVALSAQTYYVGAAFNEGKYECGGLVYLLQDDSETGLKQGFYCWQGGRAASENKFCQTIFNRKRDGTCYGWVLFKI